MATTISVVDPDNGAGTDYTSLASWESAKAGDITGGNMEWAKCRCTGGTADGAVYMTNSWVTDSSNYIRIYTDTSESYRHMGVFPPSGNIFRIVGTVWPGGCIAFQAHPDVRVDGIAMKKTDTTANYHGLKMLAAGASYVYIDNCVLVGNPSSSSSSHGMLITDYFTGTRRTIIRNNFIYDFADDGINLPQTWGTDSYVYSNTVTHCGGTGIALGGSGGTTAARNNIANGNGTDWGGAGTWDTASYNISEDTSAPGTNAKTSTAVSFEDESANDFRLASGDTAALDAGEDLSAVTEGFSTDAINTSRPQNGTWDRGAHERRATVTSIVDPDNGVGTDYTSLASWESAQAKDLAGFLELNEAECRCTDGTADGNLAFSATWGTSSTYYARVFTDPEDVYRHNGTFPGSNEDKFRISAAAPSSGGNINNPNGHAVRIEGIAVKNTSTGSARYGYRKQGADGDEYLLDNIFVGNTGASSYGINTSAGSGNVLYMRNNVVYDWSGTSAYGIEIAGAAGTELVYNSTVVDCTNGINCAASAGTNKARNNVVQGSTTDWTNTGNWDTADSNVSEDATAPGTNAKTSTVVLFRDEANDDFRLDPTDTAAHGTGADLSADADHAFDVDHVGAAREASMWDRGSNQPPTTETSIVDPDNGLGTDYTALSTWESTEVGNLITLNLIRQAECRCTGGTADTSVTTSGSWGSDDVHYARAYTDTAGGYRHDGTYSTGNTYRIEDATRCLTQSTALSWRVEGLQFKVTGNNSFSSPVRLQGNGVERHFLDNILTFTLLTPLATFGLEVTGNKAQKMFIVNNIIYDVVDGSGMLLAGKDLFKYVYNNTVTDCKNGYDPIAPQGGVDLIARNNIGNGNTTADWVNPSRWTTADSNTSEDTSAPGTNARTNSGVLFNDESANDFRLAAADTEAKNAGADLSADLDYAFAVDLVGTARPQFTTWDRGAHESDTSPPVGGVSVALLYTPHAGI